MARRIVISGGTGFIGRALARILLGGGYEVVILSRNPSRAGASLGVGAALARYDPHDAGSWAEHADGAFGIVNLAGAGIASGRWTAAVKRRILESRLEAGRVVGEAVDRASAKPSVLVQASAVGYYGDRGEEELGESSGPGSGFLAGVARRWEESTLGVERLGVRRVVIRSAVVLGRGGGFLGRMVPVFRRYVGGPAGSGRQWISWIHIADEVRAIRFLLEHGDLSGPFNLAAPAPVRNGEFARELGRALHRPSRVRTPGFLLRLALGEMAEELILSGQRALPRRLIEAGFRFSYTGIGEAFREIFGGGARDRGAG